MSCHITTKGGNKVWKGRHPYQVQIQGVEKKSGSKSANPVACLRKFAPGTARSQPCSVVRNILKDFEHPGEREFSQHPCSEVGIPGITKLMGEFIGSLVHWTGVNGAHEITQGIMYYGS